MELHTSLELGGKARHMLDVRKMADLAEALRWATESEREAVVIGGGSNLVVADSGIDGLVLRMATRGVEFDDKGDEVRVTAAAGEPWDDLVALTVAEGLSGFECLSGIPGTAGATPIQNVGAYGVEVSELVESVRVLDRMTYSVLELPASHCAFSYRFSRFKALRQRHVILAVSYRLRKGTTSAVRYPELERRLDETGARATPREVRKLVLELRRSKSMVLDAHDENRRSAGSFFLNPLVCRTKAAQVVKRALSLDLVENGDQVPKYPVEGSRVKLSAAWLVERSGFTRGTRRGRVGLSSRHALALVHHGGGSTAQLLELAGEVVTGVHDTFDVVLQPEPVFLGFPEDWVFPGIGDYSLE
jgi:UDP-N-acetylmuramate dehydrogenase